MAEPHNHTAAAPTEHDLLRRVEKCARLVQDRSVVTHHERATRSLQLSDALEALDEKRKAAGKEAADV